MVSKKKKLILKTFITQLKCFLTFVDEKIPGNEDIESLNSIISLLIQCNPNKIIYLWSYYIAKPYISIIEKGDFTYLEKLDISNDVKDLKDKASYVLECYYKTIKIVSKCDVATKKEAMVSIQILSKLSIEYHKR